MDNYRGTFDTGHTADENQGWNAANDAPVQSPDENDVHELRPESIGQDERRMQVRAYNHWSSLLGDATFPSIEDLEPSDLPDFGPNSVLLDFSTGIDDPVVQYLGAKLGEECGATGRIERLSDVPPLSLLSRITDHYMQILANQAPIGFEAEFVNQRDVSILYRGILLPFSSDNETIDFIYGVINWKEMADAAMADELLLEIDQALEKGSSQPEPEAAYRQHSDPVTAWADSPAHEVAASNDSDGDSAGHEGDGDEDGLTLPDFSNYHIDDIDDEEEEEGAGYSFASLTDYIEAPEKKAVDLEIGQFDQQDNLSEDVLPMPLEPATEVAQLPEDSGLHDYLASARDLAENARSSEDRSRHALYAAVGRAYDFSLAAKSEPEAYQELLDDAGLSVQDRAPMTPVVKLVFGHDYDKTRLTEYAAVLSHAHRSKLERGSLSSFLSEAEGGLKGVVAAERRLRREEAGKEVQSPDEIRAALAKKLRELEALTLEALASEGPEFSLAIVRRDETGTAVLLGEIADDVKLTERAARKLLG